MTAPNVVNVQTITGKTAQTSLTTTTANIITNAANSSTLVKLNNVILTNFSANTLTANVGLLRNNTITYIAGGPSIPPYSTLILLAKDVTLYLEEADVLQANASANSAMNIIASYEIIS